MAKNILHTNTMIRNGIGYSKSSSLTTKYLKEKKRRQHLILHNYHSLSSRTTSSAAHTTIIVPTMMMMRPSVLVVESSLSSLSTVISLSSLSSAGSRHQQLRRWNTTSTTSSTSDVSLSSSAAAAATSTSTTVKIATVLPTTEQLRIVAFRSAIPMIGFGIMDNVVMITAGEAIDSTFGVYFGFSTMVAAGFGQCCSDVAGVTSGGLVDAAVSKLNLKHHGLSSAQLNMKTTRFYSVAGAATGVLFGCLLGMSVLLFMDTDRADREKRSKELKSIFESVVNDGHNLVNAERATLFMVDEDKQELWSQVATTVVDGNDDDGKLSSVLRRFTTLRSTPRDDDDDDDDDDDEKEDQQQRQQEHRIDSLARRPTMKIQESSNVTLKKRSGTKVHDIIIKCPLEKGIVGDSIATGKVINVADAYSDARFYPIVDQLTGFKTKSIIVVPIFEKGSADVNDSSSTNYDKQVKKRKVIGALQMLNKKKAYDCNKNGEDIHVPFDENDEKIITVLANHVASFISIVDS